MKNCEEKENWNEGVPFKTWSATYMRGNESRVIGEKGGNHEKKEKIRGSSVRMMENETEENRDMFDENNEGYKGRSKPFVNNKKLYMKE